MAESEGFEPPVPCETLVFKTSTLDHSVNSPVEDACSFLSKVIIANYYLNSQLIILKNLLIWDEKPVPKRMK